MNLIAAYMVSCINGCTTRVIDFALNVVRSLHASRRKQLHRNTSFAVRLTDCTALVL